MSLKGFDASSNNLGIPDATIEADFIIEKATEGIGYVNPDCNPSYMEALNAGKLVGFYHWGHPENNPVDEANFFVDNTIGYFGTGVPFLDYETNTDVNWAKQWLDQVFARTGVRAMIYLSESTANAVDWSPIWHDYALWVAKYWDMSPDVNYDMSNAGPAPQVNWPYGYAMWQWSSRGRLDGYAGNLDLNEFYGDADAWRAFARPRLTTTPDTPPVVPPIVVPDPPVVIDPPITPTDPATPVEPPVVELPTVPVEVPTESPTVSKGFWSAIIAFFVYLVKNIILGVKS